jgi:hypothetical protein
MNEEDSFWQRMRKTFDNGYRTKGIKVDDVLGKINSIKSQLMGRYQVQATDPKVILSLLERALVYEKMN